MGWTLPRGAPGGPAELYTGPFLKALRSPLVAAVHGQVCCAHWNDEACSAEVALRRQKRILTFKTKQNIVIARAGILKMGVPGLYKVKTIFITILRCCLLFHSYSLMSAKAT